MGAQNGIRAGFPGAGERTKTLCWAVFRPAVRRVGPDVPFGWAGDFAADTPRIAMMGKRGEGRETLPELGSGGGADPVVE